MGIRNSAKAILVDGDQILLTKNQDEEGFFYLCPGGGQEHGETLHEAVRRECEEEVGYEVEVSELLHIREYIGKNHEFASFDSGIHQVEFYFLCGLKGEQEQGAAPSNPDDHQVGAEWVDIRDLDKYRIYPEALIDYIKKHSNNESAPVYLGDIN